MRNFLLFSVVFTGACILIIETLAVRILSPYFGSTIYTFSAILTTILTALSIGYFLGGKLSDKYPSFKLFYTIILISGFNILIVKLLISLLLPQISFTTSNTTSVLLISIILFFLPGLLLGTISPFAIKLSNKGKNKIGSAAGTVFFWSTFGSIIGSFMTGFILIPNFGVSLILISTGIILLLLGFIGLIVTKTLNIYLILIVSFGIILALINSQQRYDNNFLYYKDGIYEKIIIYDALYKGKNTRFVLQDQNNSGAMFHDSNELVFGYTKYFELYKFIKPKINNTLVLGTSASYSIPKALLADNPNLKVDAVEIEPSFAKLSKKYFNVSNTPRLTTYIMDGRRFLNQSITQYDLIYCDVYLNLHNVPMHFTTYEFLELVRSRLTTDGVFIANFIGSLSQKSPSLLLSEFKTLNTVFPNSYLFAVDSKDYLGLQNFILLGVNNNNKISFDSSAENVKVIKYLKDLQKNLINSEKLELSKQIIFKDNYAPVELLTAQLLKTL